MAFKMKGSPMHRNFGVGSATKKRGEDMEEIEKIDATAAFDPKGDGTGGSSKNWQAAISLQQETDTTIGVDKSLKTGGSTVADTVSTDKKKKRKRKNK
tara:strand:+ start:586 stop:879 length:294 start_codon:yes stop_codon:yes gene_type:complete